MSNYLSFSGISIYIFKYYFNNYFIILMGNSYCKNCPEIKKEPNSNLCKKCACITCKINQISSTGKNNCGECLCLNCKILLKLEKKYFCKICICENCEILLKIPNKNYCRKCLCIRCDLNIKKNK